MVPIELGIDTPHAVPIAQVPGVGFYDLAVDLDMRAGFINQKDRTAAVLTPCSRF
jgi:hypothetical protein